MLFVPLFVIPAKAGIQRFQTVWMPDQVRHDGVKDLMQTL
jgi:hypothetical protein